MKSLWIFRTNLRHLEYYHQYTNLQDFVKNTHDFYLLFGLWFLKNTDFDQVIVWRLQPKQKVNDIIFNVNGKKFIQKFVDDFNECFNYKSPEISFFRGGFKEYDKVVNKNPNKFGLKLYLGAGKRVFPQYGGKYDKILVESNNEINNNNTIPFFKTVNHNIFYPVSLDKKYDLSIVSNFKQLKMKGQEFLFEKISESNDLKNLNIVHCGNNPDVGKKLAKKYKINNIEFKGSVDRLQLNQILNSSKFGIVTSTKEDGSPRVCTEILGSGTPLLVRNSTRLLDYYKKNCSVIEFNDDNIIDKILYAVHNYQYYRSFAIEDLQSRLNFDIVCSLNYRMWTKK